MPNPPKNIGANGPVSGRSATNIQKRRFTRPKRRRDQEPPKFLTPNELQSLFAVIRDKRDEAIFRVMYCKGLRVSEVGMLDLRDFDDRGARLTVHRLKGSLSGTFGMHDKELRSLRAWLRIRGLAPGPLFLSRNHRPISARRLRELMETYCSAAGIGREKAHPHALKHSRGTHLLDETDALHVVQDALGHKSITSTSVYARTSNRRREDAIALNRGKY